MLTPTQFKGELQQLQQFNRSQFLAARTSFVQHLKRSGHFTRRWGLPTLQLEYVLESWKFEVSLSERVLPQVQQLLVTQSHDYPDEGGIQPVEGDVQILQTAAARIPATVT